MPAYVSHTIMAKEVYNKIENNKADLNCMLTFSLGGDLSKYSKCRKDSHRIKQEDFIYNIVNYMIDNNLTEDLECLGFLYGHICHLVMDSVIHPYIREIEKKCKPRNNNHTLIEGYYDSYLSKEKCNLEINKYDNKEILGARINKKISNMINSVYMNTYNTKHLSFYYKLNIFIYKMIKYLYKLFSLKSLKKLSGFNSFMKDNNFDILDGLDNYYDKSVDEALLYIKKINKYMHDNRR